jgi:Co/Zn/Cd efflux system component
VLLLRSYKDGDANVRSVWLRSRNDAIGNIIVMGAAIGVWARRLSGLICSSLPSWQASSSRR